MIKRCIVNYLQIRTGLAWIACFLWTVQCYTATFDPGLILNLDFNQDISAGKIVDITGNGHDGWNFNTTNWISLTNGVFDTPAGQWTYRFQQSDGTRTYPVSQYIGVTNVQGIQGLTNATISVWAKIDPNGDLAMRLLSAGYSAAYALGKGAATNSWYLGRNDTPNLCFVVFTADGKSRKIVNWPNDVVRSGGSTPDFSTTKMHLYSITIDCTNNIAIAYYDGLACQTNTIDLPWLTIYGYPTPWLAIGAIAKDGTPQWGDDRCPSGGYFVGGMDDLRIYNRTLTAPEILGVFYGTNFNINDTNIASSTNAISPLRRTALAWDQNPETNIAGYRIYYGTSSRNYTYTNDVGNMTSAIISNLIAGKTYYFVLTAYNTSGLESDPSIEISYQVPWLTSPQLPVITWNSPNPITYGTALGTAQLCATANVAGTMDYNPEPGTILAASNSQALTVSFTPTDTTNYMAAHKTVYLTVQKATLKITADNKTKGYGDPMPVLSASYDGFVNGDTMAQLTTVASLSTTASDTSVGGTYPINVTGATSSNYDIMHVNGLLTITTPPVPSTLARSFANTSTIIIPDQGGAKPYPSMINVTGMVGTVSKVTATLFNVSHTWPEDVGVLLVGPTGQKVVLMSHIGGRGDLRLNGVTLTFDDAAASSLPDPGLILSGTYRPTTYGAVKSYPAPAPVGSYNSTLSVFNGTNPNGNWSLFIIDSSSGDSGSIQEGWNLNVITIDTSTLSAGMASGTLDSMRMIKLTPANTSAETMAITSIAVYDRHQIGISFNSQPSRRYHIESTLDQQNWKEIGQVTAVDAISQFIDASATAASQRFYRIVSLPENANTLH